MKVSESNMMSSFTQKVSVDKDRCESIDVNVVLVEEQQRIVEERHQDIVELTQAINRINQICQNQAQLIQSGDKDLDVILQKHQNHHLVLKDEVNVELMQAQMNGWDKFKRNTLWVIVFLGVILALLVIGFQVKNLASTFQTLQE